MADSYSKMYVHYVITVKRREPLLHKDWREEVFKYISGIITAKEQKSIIVNGVEDHVHVFVGIKPTMLACDLIRDIKNNSSKFINEGKFLDKEFRWQAGYGAFTYGHSQVETIYKYILNQVSHHEKKSFKDEYIELLIKNEIEYNEKYLFD